MENLSFEMSILVGHKPISEYQHEGSIYVEGRKGSEYTIRLRNKTSARACFLLSVDGLSVLDGKEAGNDSPGYVLSAWETLDVACYKVDDQTGAKFEFGSKGKSYSAQTGHGTNNVGVIAALVFREKVYHWSMPIHHHHCFSGSHLTGGSLGGSPRYGTLRSMGIGASLGMNKAGSMASNSVQCSTTGPSGGTQSMSTSTSFGAAAEPETLDSFEHQALGTSFGDAMQWQTRTVTFERASEHPDTTLILYYDSKKNLEQRGIEFKKKVPPLPNPFPANTGCPVPPGWKK